MKNAAITSEQFLTYLESLGLFRMRLTENANGFEAVLGPSSPIPSLDNFTQIAKLPDGLYWVRLSNKDYFNDAITGGFFSK